MDEAFHYVERSCEKYLLYDEGQQEYDFSVYEEQKILVARALQQISFLINPLLNKVDCPKGLSMSAIL